MENRQVPLVSDNTGHLTKKRQSLNKPSAGGSVAGDDTCGYFGRFWGRGCWLRLVIMTQGESFPMP
ncbi:hypothetical protein NZD89_12080 [Alicyclobacillus fastidiosus]|uniref:Uncharacterized protein n=1 Tax=Alicyclobacillus fastidiosus TaxID=392011 RepID=A0ABY6ZQ25_9BACL|nr:hypothetical protein [Alicyclobacillus fastidiosus]WAH44045.1 hypothetical protein NZD89_12080 [Alicyclobacillus fastidiosus]